MVEFALCIPFLLMLLLGMIYFGRYFFAAQTLVFAAQETARLAARTPNLSDPAVRDAIRGFSQDGALLGPDDTASNPSPVYNALSAARMLSSEDRAHGNMPAGASIKILPFDNEGGSAESEIVTVEIQYPFGLTMDYSTGENAGNYGESIDIDTGAGSKLASFGNMNIKESASAALEICQY